MLMEMKVKIPFQRVEPAISIERETVREAPLIYAQRTPFLGYSVTHESLLQAAFPPPTDR